MTYDHPRFGEYSQDHAEIDDGEIPLEGSERGREGRDERILIGQVNHRIELIQRLTLKYRSTIEKGLSLCLFN